MPSLLVLKICLLLPDDYEGLGWIWFLHSDSVEDEGDNYGVNNFLGMTTWILRFSNDNINVEMMLPP